MNTEDKTLYTLTTKLMQLFREEAIDDFSLEPGIMPRGWECSIQKSGVWFTGYDYTLEGAILHAFAQLEGTP